LKTWERTKTPGLLRHKGGRYYGRFSIGGKTKFVPLNCTLMEIARVRFAEEKAKIERVRRAARANEQGVATLGQLLEIYRGRITNKTGIAESTRKRNLENVGFIQRTWPGIEKLHPGLITRTEIENWRDRALSKGTGFRPPGAKSESTLVSGRSASSFNKALDALRTMLDYAVDAGTIHVNPVRGNDGLKAKLDPKKPQLRCGLAVASASANHAVFSPSNAPSVGITSTINPSSRHRQRGAPWVISCSNPAFRKTTSRSE